MLFGLLLVVRFFVVPSNMIADKPTATSLGQRQAMASEVPLLAEFSSLAYPLAHSKLVGIYFAAAWCPVSTPVTEMINTYLGETLLRPPESSSHVGSGTKTGLVDMSLVYVSSDRSQEAFDHYLGTHWIAIPYADEPQRTSLKKHFRVCAKPEKERLGVDRKAGIPSLIIVNSETQEVLTSHGEDDLEEYKDKAVDYWLGLRT